MQKPTRRRTRPRRLTARRPPIVDWRAPVDSVGLPLSRVSPRQIGRFIGVFLGVFLIAHHMLEREALWAAVREPYCVWLAEFCAALLRFCGLNTSTAGNLILVDELRLRIVQSCDALVAMSILCAGILAFPVTWRARWMGLAVGLPVIFLLNLFRIVTLTLLGVFSFRLFEILHVYVFQVFIIATTVGYFVWWTSAAAKGHLVRRSPSPAVLG